MDEDYLMALMEMIQQQRGGGLQGSFQGQYGEHPTSPTGQYRTHKTPYISDGNVPLSRAFPNPNDFSADAFFDLDPRLKGVAANAVRSGEHDPYSVYASLDDPEYQYALFQKAIGELNLEPVDVNIQQDQYGRSTYPNIENLLDDLQAREEGEGRGTQKVSQGLVPQIMSGKYTGEKEFFKDIPIRDLIEQKRSEYQGALDDFVTQAAPSMERNTNMIDHAWTRSGGMPFPGINSDPLDYEGSGPAFPTATQTLRGGGRAAPARKAAPTGNWQKRLGGGKKKAATPKPKAKATK